MKQTGESQTGGPLPSTVVPSLAAEVDVTISSRDAVVEDAYRCHGSAVYALARSICGPVAGADVTQDVFVGLWSRPDRFDPGRGSLRTYLLTSCRSRAIDVLRAGRARRRRESAAGDPVVGETGLSIGDVAERSAVEREVVRLDDRARVRELVEALPPLEREAVVVAFYGSRTYREAAVALGCPEGTVKSRIRRGLSRLHAALEQEAESESAKARFRC